LLGAYFFGPPGIAAREAAAPAN